jgi:diguanylate cyclase (GGDEF)-like protein
MINTFMLQVAPTSGAEELKAIVRKLEKPIAPEEIRALRTRLEECLGLVGSESPHEEAPPEGLVMAQEKVAGAADQPHAARYCEGIDAVTGLWGRGEAEKTLAAKIERGKNCFATVFVVERLSALNVRFGRAVGDEVLFMIAQHLAQRLPENSSLFRWSGPAFVAILDDESDGTVERQMKQIASERLEKSVETRGRSILLPITMSFILQRISGSDSAEKVCCKLGKMTAACVGEAALL